MDSVFSFLIRTAFKLIVCAIASFYLSACNAGTQIYSVNDLISDPGIYSNREVYVDACILSSRHDLALADCADASKLIAVGASEDVMQTEGWKKFKAFSYLGWTTQSAESPNARLAGTLRIDKVTGKSTFHVSEVISVESKKTLYKNK